jgi:cysteinyl-tRNA synthetase
MIKLFNTLTRKKEELKTVEPGVVRIYSCGPTVYNVVHIGNLRAFISADILRRWLKYRNYKLMHVMNITDVDDKTIRDSQKEGVSLKEFTDRYTKLFFEDLKALNIQPVEYYPRATECIDGMVKLIQTLLDKGIAYKSDDGSIYYDISKFKDYGKLAHLDLSELKAGARVKHDSYEKKNIADFALWKAWDENDGDVFWETPIGKGRPGWHIECSVMSMKNLGETIDIHTGGIDLVFPHHQNEIAQSEGATGKPFVKYWVHNEHLIVEGKKMSKSLGNFFTLRDLINKGYSSKAIRWVLMSTHYRKKLDFTFQDLDAAKKTLMNLQDFMFKLDHADGSGASADNLMKKAQKEFEDAMDDDLNISQAQASMFEFIHEINKLINEKNLSKEDAQKVKGLMMKFDQVFGVLEEEKQKIPEEVLLLVRAREDARIEKDWETADAIRNRLKEHGYVLEDMENGVRVKKIK